MLWRNINNEEFIMKNKQKNVCVLNDNLALHYYKEK